MTIGTVLLLLAIVCNVTSTIVNLWQIRRVRQHYEDDRIRLSAFQARVTALLAATGRTLPPSFLTPGPTWPRVH